jgi:hypothetical protein
MPSSQTLSQNHAAICAALEISPQTLNRWVAAAPLLLLVPAVQLQKRFEALARILAEQAEARGIPCAAGLSIADPALERTSAAEADNVHMQDLQSRSSSSSSRETHDNSSSSDWLCVALDPQHFRAYIDKDPRVLLLKPGEVLHKLAVLQQELCCSPELLLWLVLQHPSYLAVEPGSASAWAADVRHLCQMSSAQVLRLLLCPQVGSAMKLDFLQQRNPCALNLCCCRGCGGVWRMRVVGIRALHAMQGEQVTPRSARCAAACTCHFIPHRLCGCCCALRCVDLRNNLNFCSVSHRLFTWLLCAASFEGCQSIGLQHRLQHREPRTQNQEFFSSLL